MTRITVLLFILSIYSCADCVIPEPIPCGGSESNPKVDLVVIMDQSSSMNDEATAVTNATAESISIAKKDCNVDLRTEFLAITGVSFPNSLFTQTVRNYLNSVNQSTLNFALDDYSNLTSSAAQFELGAAAMDDVSQYFDWREEACKAILYISDEPVNGGSGTPIESENQAVENAIQSALNNEVALFTNSLNDGAIGQVHLDNYEKITIETGGLNFFVDNANVETYLLIMPQIICNACNACQLNQFINN